MDIENMTEQQALDVFYAMRRRFGWQGIVVTRGDAEEMWATVSGLDGAEDLTLGDREWSVLVDQYEWRKMDDYLATEAYDGLRDAVCRSIEFLAESENG